jgi:hypothetical protein
MLQSAKSQLQTNSPFFFSLLFPPTYHKSDIALHIAHICLLRVFKALVREYVNLHFNVMHPVIHVMQKKYITRKKGYLSVQCTKQNLNIDKSKMCHLDTET